MKLKSSLLALLFLSVGLNAPLSAAQHHSKPASKAKISKVGKARTKTSAVAKGAKLAAVGATAAVAAKAASAHHASAAHGAMSYQEVSSVKLSLQSSAVVVQDQSSGEVLFEKNSNAVLPIASITKLMTAMVTLDAHLDLHEAIRVEEHDVDMLKRSTSHIPVGTVLSREMMLRLALMSSENRAANSLGRNYPGGPDAFVVAMNRKAKELGLRETRFYDPTGLNANNVSSARDLAKMVAAASRYPLIREFTTTSEYDVPLGRHMRTFYNTNALVRGGTWEIGVSKTGYINESGKCLVMQAWLNNRPTIIVLLDSWGKLTRIGDANRIKRWIEANASRPSQS